MTPETIWFLGAGAMPVPASPVRGKRKGKPRPPSGVTHWCREGDTEWRPIATFLAPVTSEPAEETTR
jgi:hypothetical protein